MIVGDTLLVVDSVVGLSTRTEGEQASLIVRIFRFFKVTGQLVLPRIRELVIIFYDVEVSRYKNCTYKEWCWVHEPKHRKIYLCLLRCSWWSRLSGFWIDQLKTVQINWRLYLRDASWFLKTRSDAEREHLLGLWCVWRVLARVQARHRPAEQSFVVQGARFILVGRPRPSLDLNQVSVCLDGHHYYPLIAITNS